MSWPASTQSTDDRFAQFNRLLSRTRSAVETLSVLSQTTAIPRVRFVALAQQVQEVIGACDALIALPVAQRDAFVARAQQEFANPALNVVSEFTAVRTAALTLRNWISANFPRDGSGALLTTTATAEWVETPLTFSPTDLAGYRTQAAAFVATIG